MRKVYFYIVLTFIIAFPVKSVAQDWKSLSDNLFSEYKGKIISIASDITDLGNSEVAERDGQLIYIFNNLEQTLNRPSEIGIKFRKIRGYQVGGSAWYNEKWAYIITVHNNSDSVKNFSASLTYYDTDGFKLDDTFIYIKNIQPYNRKKLSKNFFLSLNYINMIRAVKLIGNGIE